ncbi:5248_t:CDS:2, partial [Cetraspora pellucida]
PSYKTLKKEIAIANITAKNQINDLLAQSSETISLTTDFWTARNKTGYIGITAHWLSNKFELNKILLCLESMLYPHTGRSIREFLISKVQEFNLQNKILCVVTDNGSNMIRAIRNWKGVERLLCTAHTLQLSINHTAQIKTQKNKQNEMSYNIPILSDESGILQETSNFDSESESSDDENKNIPNIIYNSLFEYWDCLLQICLLAIFLDFWLKEMSFANAETRNNTINEYEFTDELDSYLDLRQTPLAFPEKDHLLWWQQQQSQFPTLSKLARKYHSVSATSAPSKCIFFDSGNHITPQYSNLKPKLVSQMLFLKRNNNFINMFPNSHMYKKNVTRLDLG